MSVWRAKLRETIRLDVVKTIDGLSPFINAERIQGMDIHDVVGVMASYQGSKYLGCIGEITHPMPRELFATDPFLERYIQNWEIAVTDWLVGAHQQALRLLARDDSGDFLTLRYLVFLEPDFGTDLLIAHPLVHPGEAACMASRERFGSNREQKAAFGQAMTAYRDDYINAVALPLKFNEFVLNPAAFLSSRTYSLMGLIDRMTTRQSPIDRGNDEEGPSN